MVNISIAEFAVYGFIAYSSVLMLIISTIRETPTTKSFAISRVVYMLLGVIFAFVLAMSGPSITFPTVQTSISTIAINSSEYFTETQVAATTLPLVNGPLWVWAHMLMGLLMLMFVIVNILDLLTKRN